MGSGSSAGTQKFRQFAEESINEFQKLEKENALLREENARLLKIGPGAQSGATAQRAETPENTGTDTAEIGCGSFAAFGAILPVTRPEPPKKEKPGFMHRGHKVHMQRPAEDVNLHPDTAIYGATTVMALPFPAGAQPRACAEIDLTAIYENTCEVQKIAAKTGRFVMAVLEANAYGHGAVPVAHTLYKCNGVDYFGVSTVNEGVELRMSGLPSEARIIVWITHSSEWKICTTYHLDICLVSEAMADEMVEWCEKSLAAGELECPLRAHVMINKGSSRLEPEGLGLQLMAEDGTDDNFAQCAATAALIRKIDVYESIKFVGIMAHLNPKTETTSQLMCFKKMIDTVRAQGSKIEIIHLENSDTLCSEAIPPVYLLDLLRGPNGEYDTKGYCRIGGALYGLKNYDFLKPCIRLMSQIRHTHVCKKGCPVGYERAWINPGDNVIATLAIGFADGYARAFSNAGSYGFAGTITIAGHPFPIAGKVCMDMLMVNCGPPDGPAKDVKVGDYGILFGPGGVSLRDAAALLKTIPEDITCDFTRRIERRYVRPPNPTTGFFICTSVEEKLHPEVLYGAHAVGSFPFPEGCEVRVKLEVDLGKISENAGQLQKLCARTGRKLMGILKANAYGMGSCVVGHMLAKCNGMDFFGVASINEAIELRMSGIPSSVHILVLGPTDPTEWKAFNYWDLDIGVQSKDAVKGLIAWAYQQKKLGNLFRPMRVHVLLNTGMSRVGLQTFFAAEDEGLDEPKWRAQVMETALVIKRVDDADKDAILFTSCMTHMCDAHKGNPFTQTQFKRLKRTIDATRSLGVHIPMIHMENSEATLENLVTDEQVKEILNGPNGEYKSIGYCRSGGGMYGQRNYDIIKPACALKAQIRNVHVTADGDVIATLSVGYADGFSKEFGNDAYGKKGKIGIHGVLCPIAGKIHMDALTVNCGKKTGEVGSKVKVGDYGVLFGPGGPSLKEAAGLLTTAQSDVTCDLTRRPERFYINAPQPK